MKLRAPLALLLLMSSSALAADLAPQPAEPSVPPVEAYSWNGFYVGAQLGYSWARDAIHDRNLTSGITDYRDHFNPDGVIGGVHAGYNYQWNAAVLGVEGDAQLSDVKGTNDAWPFGDYSKTRIPAQGSIRLRVGYAFDRFLIYGTGGVAIGDIRTTFADSDAPIPFDRKSDTKLGWTVGAGVEYGLTDHWTGRVEYRYTGFNKVTTPTPNTDNGWSEVEKINGQSVSVGASYKF